MNSSLDKAVVCIVGLGYVGLPLAQAFARSLKVIGFDVSQKTVRELNESSDNQNLTFTSDPKEIARADFVIICVPTPVTKSKDPDLSYVISAAETAGQHMKRGSVVILESSVYPGVTEEVLVPVLERFGLKCGLDFRVAFSPERVNPGDTEHSVDKIAKVVAGMDEETTELVAELYRRAIRDVFVAKDIRTAEAAKIIENIQRDLNIALMNELSLIFERMGLSTKDVLDAAATKWNFHRYSPGLVGGHCIPVDPYYLVHKAEELGYHPQVILAGRGINDNMPRYIAEVTVSMMKSAGKPIKGAKVLIMGLSYKENVADTREAPARHIIEELGRYGVKVLGFDPLLGNIEAEFGVESVSTLKNLTGIDAVIITVAHKVFGDTVLDELKQIMSREPVLVDIRGMFCPTEAEGKGFHYKTL